MIKKYFLILIVSLCFVMSGFGQTFNQVTTLAGLTDGNYLIAADGNTNDGLMLNSTAGSVYIDYTNITNPGATINSGFTGNNIFSITVSGGNITINNSSVGYVSWGRSPATANDADFYNGTVADTERWTPTVSGGLWTLSNVDTSARMLQWNNSSPRFSAYTSNQVKLKLYKQAVTGPAITATPTTITGLDYGFGNGPSTEQSFDVTGTLLVAGTTVTSNSTDFQVSLTAVGGYASSVNIPAGTLNGTTTIYTRLVAGLAINTYSNTISISNATPGIGTTPTINVSGEVTPPQADVVITEIMYNSTGTDDEWIEICNLNGIAQDISNYEIEVNNSSVYTFSASTSIPANTCITVALGDNGTAPYNPDCPFTADYGSPSGTNILTNSTRTIELVASDNTTVIDAVTYTTGDGANGNGSSLHVIDATLDNSSTGTNWQEVTNGGSPGDNTLISPCSISAPEINVEGNLGSFPDIAGDLSNVPSGLDNTLFAGRPIATSEAKTFRIKNEGTLPLTLGTITIIGSNPGDFTITGTAPATSIPVGNYEILEITFSPLAIGPRTARVEIRSNDPDEDPFRFNIQGAGECSSATYTLSPNEGPAGTIVTVTATSGSNPDSSTALYDGNSTTVTNITASVFEITIPNNAISSNISFNDATGCTRNLPFIVIEDDITSCEGTGTLPTEIFISEVTDRDSSVDGHTYVELFNGTGSPVNIEDYTIEVHSNGGSSASGVVDIPNGTILANNDTYVVSLGTNATVTDPVSQNDYFSSNTIGINDRDHIILTNGSIDIDLWGDKSGNPFTGGIGTEYNGPTPNGSDYTYRRKNTSSPPSLTWSPSDWDLLTPVNYSDIGNYAFSAGTAPNVTAQPTPQVSNCELTASFTVSGQETYTGAGNSQFITYLWFYSAPGDSGWNEVPNTAPYTGYNTDNLEITNTLNLDGYQYYCQIREDDAFCYTASKAVRLNIEKAIWTSTGWSSPPTSNKIAIIDEDYDTSNGTFGEISFDACSLIINSGNTLVIKSNDYVNVNFNVTNNGTLNIENNGSLVQIDDSGVNTGNINMERKASVDNLDYVYWSSPVSNFDVNNISTTQYIYKWNPTFNNTNGTQGNWIPASGDMDPGVGYIVRGFGSQAAPVTPGDLNFTVDFVGVPFNGLKPVTLSKGSLPGVDDNWNLVGNPYPSAVDVFLFLDHSANSVLDGFVHFWTHGNDPVYVTDPFYYDFGSNYTETDYIAFNAVGAGNAPGNISIAAGQSFMVNLLESAPSNPQIEFNNSMRNKAFDNSQFYRTTEPNYHTAEKHRIWLDLVSETQGTNRILVGYVEGATMERDRMYDAITSITATQNLYSLIDDTPFIIQGRSLPFNDTDAIPLGVNIIEQGNYHLAIAYIDGLFETENKTIYLKDNQLGFIHNLIEAPYSFTSDAGNFNDRFELVFRDSFLSINEVEISASNVTIIEHQNGEVQFIVPNQFSIKTVDIIDLLGRTIYNLYGNSYSETYNLTNLSQATYIAKITLSNGQVITKKAVKRK